MTAPVKLEVGQNSQMQQAPVRSKDRFLVFGAPAIEEAEIEEVVDCLRSGWLGTGSKVARFEEDFRQYQGAQYAIGVNSCRHAYHLYTILVDESKTGISREMFLDAMTYHNIGVDVHYLSLPEHPYYQNTLSWQPQNYPNAMKLGRQTVSLPISAKLTDADIDDVIEVVCKIIRK